MARTHLTLLLTAASLLSPALSPAAPLQEASISKIVNEVRVVDPSSGGHPATLEEKIHQALGVKTGVKSRAELLFQDNTLTRLGAETYFSFQPGTRDMTLREGTMLLQVPKGLGGAKIHTAAVTASITGTTIMIESWPGRDVKVVVLEGSLRLSVDSRLGEAVTLTPGKMLLMKPGDKHLPDPVDIDLAKLVKTSALIDPATFKGKSKINVAPLPSLGLIQKEIVTQGALKQKAGLVDTNLIIQGKGGKVELASAETMAGLADGKLPKAILINVTQTASELNNDSAGANDKAAIVRDNLEGKLHGLNDRPGPTPLTHHSGDEPVSQKPPEEHPPEKQNDAFSTITSPSPYPLSAGTTVDSGKPSITTGGVTAGGGVYYGENASQFSPTEYFFDGAPSALDGAFNADFARRDGALGIPTAGLAAFRFQSAELGTQPVFTGTRLNLALVSVNGLGPAATTGTWNLGALNSLTLAAAGGSVTLANAFQATAGTPFQLFDVYARTGNLTVSSNLSFPSATVALWAGGSLTLDAASTVNAFNLLLRATGPITLDGSVTAGSLSVFSAGDLIIHSAPSAPLDVTAAGLVTSVNLAGQGGSLVLGADGLQAGVQQLTGFSRISSTGNVTAAGLQATGAIAVSGAIVRATGSTTLQLDAPQIAAGGGIDVSGASGATPGAGGQLTVFSDSLLIDAQHGGEGGGDDGGPSTKNGAAIAGLNADGGHATPLSLSAGGDGGSIDLGTSTRPIAGDVLINQTVSASNGAGGTAALTTGAGGAVRVVANGTVAVNSTIKVSDATARTGGQVRLESRKTSGTAIDLGSSAQILALLNAASVGPGGTVQLVSAGGNIAINGGTINADRGTVDIRNNGNGLVTLSTANLHGDVVKVGALGPNGQLIIGRGVIDATSAISLYAGGSNGTVLFNKSVTLSGAAMKTIAANTVTISNGQKVNVTGPAANVYTNNANYSGSGGNGSTKGQFTGSGASTHPFSGAPAF